MNDQLTRRQVLRTASLTALAAFLPASLRSIEVLRALTASKVLILVELEGGNDGLNTIVPFGQSAYATKRPTLKLTQAANAAADYITTFVPLGGTGYTFSGAQPSTAFHGDLTGLGIHKALDPLQAAWQNQDLAVVLGVGYGNPNRSHFRGIDIWNSAVTDDQPLASTGWLGRMLAAQGVGTSTTNGLLFRRPNNNPLTQAGLREVSLSKPEDFIANSAEIATLGATAPVATGNAALDLILTARFQAAQARASLDAAMKRIAPVATWDGQFPPGMFPATTPARTSVLGPQAEHIARCIIGSLDCPFYKMSIGGFDNHTDQQAKHADLLGDVAQSLAALRTALITAGRWNDVLIMTYSEFGRRVEENDSKGTDHGTAAPHFFLGGGINGGVYGTQPSLTALDTRGDLQFSTDFRELYATCGSWLGVSAGNSDTALNRGSGSHSPISGLFS